MIDYTTHNMEKKKYKNQIQKLKSHIQEKRAQMLNNIEDTCVNLYRVINVHTSGNPVYVNKNGIIYNSIYNFKESMSTNKKLAALFEMRIMCKKEKCKTQIIDG